MRDRTIIRNVTTIDEEGRIRRGRRVVISEGVINSIEEEPAGGGSGTGGEGRHGAGSPGAAAGRDGVVEIDGSRRFLSPSLVNLHTHLAMNILKGIAEDVTVDAWFNEEIWPYESSMTEEDIALGTRLAVAESLDNGVSAAADHYFSAHLICRETLAAGMRLDMSPTLFGLAGDYEKQLDAATELVEEWHRKDGMVRLRLGPHAPYTCNPEQLRLTAERAGRLGIGAHIHASESAEQVRQSLETHGKTPLAVIADAGLLRVPTILAHGVFFTEKDRELLEAAAVGTAGADAPHGPVMALCPKTYRKLGTGMGEPLNDIAAWPVTVGTDGAASSNTLSPVEQARVLGLWAKNRAGSGAALPATELWRILMRGHRILGFGSGRLAAGAPADLILWNLDDPATAPVYDPLTAIIYSSHRGNVESLWVAGRRLKSDGRLAEDTSPLYEEARERVAALLRRGKGKTKLVY